MNNANVEQHPDDAAVDALAALMKAKLARQRAKGYGGWNDKTQCPQQRLSDMLRAHVEKGDPVDVANFCAMLSARGEGIAAAPQAVQAAVPDDVERKAFEAWAQRHYRNADAYTYSDYLMGFEGWKARAALAAAQPAAQGMDARTSIGTLWVEENGVNDLELCPCAAPKLAPGEYALFAQAKQGRV